MVACAAFHGLVPRHPSTTMDVSEGSAAEVIYLSDFDWAEKVKLVNKPHQ